MYLSLVNDNVLKNHSLLMKVGPGPSQSLVDSQFVHSISFMSTVRDLVLWLNILLFGNDLLSTYCVLSQELRTQM